MAALRLGLTGGIGSGKSTVAGMLAELGASVLDADAESRRTTGAGGAAIGPIATLFGPQFIDAHGALNRDAMRARVFEDPSARKRLEEIIHPLVQDAITRLAEQANASGSKCVVFDIPLLVESGRWPARLDAVLVVDCETRTQISRVARRNGLQEDAVLGIIQAQAPRPQRLAAADIVIFNDGKSLDELRAEVASMARRFGL
jgi:dephospho-CoA kinase